MKFTRCLFVLFAITNPSAFADDRHHYESLYLYFAYRLEARYVENKNDHVIGVKCKSMNVDSFECIRNKGDESDFVRCKGTIDKKGKKLCNINEFLTHISGNKLDLNGKTYTDQPVQDFKDTKLIAADAESLDFDVDATVSRWAREQTNVQKAARYAMYKNNFGYTRAIASVSTRISQLRSNPPDLSRLTEADRVVEERINARILDQLELARSKVVLTRRIDRSENLMERLDKEPWAKHVDWQFNKDRGGLGSTFAMRRTQKANGVYSDRIEAVVKEFKQEERVAKHDRVIAAFATAADRAMDMDECWSDEDIHDPPPV